MQQQTASFANLLKQRRRALGWTQEALAEAAQISVRAVSDLERGLYRIPQRDTVILLARALQLSAADSEALEASIKRGRGPRGALTAKCMPSDPSSAGTSGHTLPLSPTPLLGRNEAISAAVKLLQRAEVRLLTLTGTGGVGKTRLGLEVGRELLGEYAGGVVLVELAAVRDPDLVAPTIAHTLGVRESEGQPPLEALRTYLRQRQLLLLLDNFEHLLPAAPLLANLLAHCTALKLLVTSRAPLHLRAETELPVAPLALPMLPTPASRHQLAVNTIASSPAVGVFMQRAHAVRPGFALNAENESVVGEICRQLDGLPLAIELAAARLKILSPQALRTRLEPRLHLLTGGARDQPARHQTMRSAIAWSYDLLAADEQVLFARLSVFSGGCSLEAVETVCAPSGGAETEVLGALAALVDSSLVQTTQSTGGEMRFRMLETIREYGLECLSVSGVLPSLRQRHADYALTLAEQAEPQLVGATQAYWLARLDNDHDNLRAALKWFLETGAAALGLRLAGALARFWYVHGDLTEGRRWLESFLTLAEHSSNVNPSLRARALHGAGTLAIRQGAYRDATSLADQSLILWRELEDIRGIAAACNSLGSAALDQGDFATAMERYQESLALWREVGDTQRIANVLSNLGNVACDQCAYAQAMALYEESLSLRRELGDPWGLPSVLGNMANVAQAMGNYTVAEALGEESLTGFRAVGDLTSIAIQLANLGGHARDLGNYERAVACSEECLDLARQIGHRWSISLALDNLARVARDTGDLPAAAALFEEALSVNEELNDNRGIPAALGGLGQIACLEGNYEQAIRLLAESLARFQAVNNPVGSAGCLESLAVVAFAGKHFYEAAQLGGAAETLRAATGAPLPFADRAPHDRMVTDIHAALGDPAFAKAWNAGSAFSLNAGTTLSITHDGSRLFLQQGHHTVADDAE